jgi:transcriptional regulator with XRE-family HTH domain
MPKSVDVEDFAAKLALIAKRLNWSRTKLAQQIGVDKSLAARWLGGKSRPSGNSLMQVTAAVAQAIDGFAATDWDLPVEPFARRIGIEGAIASRSGVARLMLSGLRNPPPVATWGAAYVGLWAGFYQSLTNRGVVRLSAGQFAIDAAGLHLSYTDGFFTCEASVVVAHNHLHAIGEIRPLDNHLIFFSLNAAHDAQGVAVIDGLKCAVGPDDTPTASPLLLFRLDRGADETIDLPAVRARVAATNEQIESEAARTGNLFAVTQQLAAPEILRTLCPTVGAARTDGEVDHVLRVPQRRSLATGRRAMSSLPAGAPLRLIPSNLRRVLGLDEPDRIRLVHAAPG